MLVLLQEGLTFDEFVAALGVQVILSTGAFGSQAHFTQGKVTLTTARRIVGKRCKGSAISKQLLVQTILAAEVRVQCFKSQVRWDIDCKWRV
jgi:uncharacterized membrane protein YjdF